MRWNWRRLLWGLLPLVLLSVVAVEVERGRLEGDLGRRAALALAEAGLGWAAADFEGRDGVLAGLAPQEGEPQKAAELLASVWGVRRIENRAGLIEKAEHYQWWASRRNARVRLSGNVPSSSARQAILGVTRATFPGLEVVDRMTLARGVPDVDDWLAGISFALQQLAALRRGEVRLDGLTLALAGEAEDAMAYRNMHAALRSALPRGISLLSAEVIPPAVVPYTWAARSLEGGLLLKGHVPSEGDRAALLAAAKESAPGAQLEDEMQPASGAPQGWATAAIACLRELPRLEAGSAELTDAVLVVAGTTDAASATAVRDRLRAALPPTITLRDAITAREAPPEAPPPAAAAPAAAAERAPPEGGAGMPPAQVAAPPAQVAAPPAQVVATPAPVVAPPVAIAATPPQSTPVVAPSAPIAAAPAAQPAPVAAPPAPMGAAQTAPAAAPPASAASASAGVPSEPPQLPRVVSDGDPRTQGCRDALADAAKAGTIFFRLGSAVLDATSFATLGRLAKAAQSCPGMMIEVAGHASADGGEAVNRRLSLRRAQAVVAYLIGAGVERQQLESVGFGSSRPMAPNDSSEHMAQNRRIEFTVRPQ